LWDCDQLRKAWRGPAKLTFQTKWIASLMETDSRAAASCAYFLFSRKSSDHRRIQPMSIEQLQNLQHTKLAALDSEEHFPVCS
jgi:hypothetical protein